MVDVLPGLLRRYAGGEHALAQTIAQTLIRQESIAPVPKGLPEPPKSYSDLLMILTDEIIPLHCLNEWDDDHVLCGDVSFVVNDKQFYTSLWYAGAGVIGAFDYPDSPSAMKVAAEAILESIVKVFDHGDNDYSLEIALEQATASKEIIKIEAGYHMTGWQQDRIKKKYSQEGFERSFGPYQPYAFTYSENSNRAGQVDKRWMWADSLEITPSGTFWRYTTENKYDERFDYTGVIERVPVDTVLLHKVEES